MNRREALRRLAFLTGGALSVTTVAGVLGGCEAPDRTADTHTIQDDLFDMVEALAERIIPETDTPGASEAGVPGFIDRMVTDWMTVTEREHFLDELERVQGWVAENYDDSVSNLSEEEQDDVLRHFAVEAEDHDAETVTLRLDEAWGENGEIGERVGTEQYDEIDVTLQPFFRIFKELTMVGYYTSEIGATEELQYIHAPGRYEGCAPLEEVGRTWA